MCKHHDDNNNCPTKVAACSPTKRKGTKKRRWEEKRKSKDGPLKAVHVEDLQKHGVLRAVHDKQQRALHLGVRPDAAGEKGEAREDGAGVLAIGLGVGAAQEQPGDARGHDGGRGVDALGQTLQLFLRQSHLDGWMTDGRIGSCYSLPLG